MTGVFKQSGVEASTFSKSVSETSVNANRQNLVSGKSSKFDMLFPLFDQMYQKIELPSLISKMVNLYVCVQFLLVSFWIFSPFYVENEDVNTKVIEALSQGFWLTKYMPNERGSNFNYIVILFLIILILLVISVIFFIGLVVNYNTNHRFHNWSLYLMKILAESVSLILILPSASLIGSCFIILIDYNKVEESEGHSTTIFWLFLIFAIISMIGFQVIFQYGYYLQCHSVYLTTYSYSSYDPKPISDALIVSELTVILQYLFTIFPNWCLIVVQVLHILMICLICFKLRYHPFHIDVSNYLFFGIFVASGANDVLMIVANFVKFPFYIPIIVIVVVLIVATILAYFFFDKKMKSITSEMAQLEMTDDEINAFLDNNSLNTDKDKAIMFNRIGFMRNCPFFITFQLSKHISATFNETIPVSACLQIVSYFPSESRLMNSLLSCLCGKRDLSFWHRFLIYEVYRLNTLRQSSASSAANEMLSDLKNKSLQAETFVRSCYSLKQPDVAAFEQISTKNKKVQSLWQEGIYNYPNNSKYYEEYSRFLIEAPADYYGAVLQRRNADLIDVGHNFAVDYAFIQMVRSYPNYLKKGFLDSKGNIRIQSKQSKPKDGMMSTTTSESSDHSSTIKGNIDQEVEDSVGKVIIRQAKMRLALHHSVENRTIQSHKMLPYALAIGTIAFIVCFIVIFVFMKESFVSRKTSMNRLSYISKCRFYMALTDDCIFYRFILETNRFTGYDQLMEYGKIDSTTDSTRQYIRITEPIKDTIIQYMNECRNYYILITDELASLSEQGENVYEIAAPFFSNLVNLTICHTNGDFLPPQPSTLKAVIVYSLYVMAEMSNYDDTINWYNSSIYCGVIKNWDMTMVGSGMVFKTLTDDQDKRFDQLQTQLMIMMIIFPIALFLVSFIPVLALTISFYRRLKSVSRVLINLNNDVKNDATKPIRLNFSANEQQTDVVDIRPEMPRHIKLLIVYAIFSIITAIFSFLMVFFANKTNEDINRLNKWEYFCCNRLSLCCECFHMIITAPVLNESILIDFMSQQSEVDLGTSWMEQLDEMNEGLLQGSTEMNSLPCFGYDDELDRINLQEACQLDSDDTNLHDTYRCASANQGIASFRNFVIEICKDPNHYKGQIGDEITNNFFHLSNSHLWFRLEESIDRILELAVDYYNTMITELVILMIFGILLSLATLVFGILIYKSMRIATEGALTLIKRINPIDIVNNKTLINILLNKETEQKEHGMSTEQSIIHNSFDSIICTSLNGVIEIVNPSVTNLLGYTPEQLLGQQPMMLFNEESSELVSKQLGLMRDKQSGPVYEDHVIVLSDSANEIPCHMTLFAISSNGTGEANSFVLILRDETELTKQQQIAEEAKKQSENLLFQILPRDIVTRLNAGEKDISFTVQSASIIFIDIVKFSDYSSMLTPQEIMGNLSLVFEAFDECCKKYNLLLKIKLIGDVYMAAAGLFNPEEKPQTHAEQTVRFALDCLAELETVNVKLNANLCVRIGINSGGPLLAGVLGTDKPVFDIIGDPINLASRLQSTDIPGCIQIPQATLDLIADCDFYTEPRGEVFLKGKGKTMAFLVHPSSPFTNTQSSEE